MKRTDGFAQIDGAKVWYETAGSGPAVVLGHAGFVDSRMWDGQFEVLARKFQVVRYDLRGFGRSDPLEGPVSRSAELLGVLRELGIARAALVGCSLSGATVIHAALEHPDMVTALVPVSAVPGGFEMRGEAPAELMEMIGALQQGDLERAAELQMRLWIDGPMREPGSADAAVRRQALEMTRAPLANATFFMEGEQALQPPAAQRLGEIRVPTLVVAGALDNSEILRAAEVMAESIPGARKLVMESCAHLPNMEKPEAFNRVVAEFLERAMAEGRN